MRYEPTMSKRNVFTLYTPPGRSYAIGVSVSSYVCLSIGDVCLSVFPSVCVCLFFRLSVCLFVCLSVYLFVSLSIDRCCLSVGRSIRLTVCLFVYLSVRLSVRLSVCLFVYLSVRLSVRLSVCLSVCLSICLSVCLSIDRSLLFVCQSFCLSVCEQDYCKNNGPISLKFAVMILPTRRKNWLTCGGDPVPDTDSGLLFFTSLAIAE